MTADMTRADLLDTDVEETLRGTRARRCSPTAVRPAAVLARATTATGPLDRRPVEGARPRLGLAGLLVPEELGGAGASAREAAVVLEELGRAVAPVPFLTSAVVATTALLAAAHRRGPTLLGARRRGAHRGAGGAAVAASPCRPPASSTVPAAALTGRVTLGRRGARGRRAAGPRRRRRTLDAVTPRDAAVERRGRRWT